MNTSTFLTYANSDYSILENIKSGIGEWNSVFGNFTNNLIIGYTCHNESRAQISSSRSSRSTTARRRSAPYTSFGSEPFTPFNLLTYSTFQMQDNVTRFANNTRSPSAARSRNSTRTTPSTSAFRALLLQLAGRLLHGRERVPRESEPDRFAGDAGAFQVKFLLQPGQTTPPLQPLDVGYTSGYAQDEWRPRSNLTVTAGLRVDVPKFGNTAFDNPIADGLTFRDRTAPPSCTTPARCRRTSAFWSPRVGFN